MADLPGGHLSPSQIDSYCKCPHRYYEERIMGRKQPTTLPMIMGTVWGEVIGESCLRVRKGEEPFTGMEATANLQTRWKLPLTGRGVKKKDAVTPSKIGPLPDELLGFARDWSKFKLDDLEPIDIDGKFGMELKVEQKIAGVDVIGYVDLVERGVISDFKVAGSASYYDPCKSTQLIFYATALEIPRIGFMVFEKKTGQKVDRYLNVDLKAAKKYLENLVDHVARGIEHDIFPARTDTTAAGEPWGKNYLCSSRWCPFWSECVGSVAR